MADYSTGRGGKGNLASPRAAPDELTPEISNSEALSSTFSHDREGNVIYSTGRGGAGNMGKGSGIPSPTLVPQGSNTPNLLQPVFSTGRGGYGNMKHNVDPQTTRKAQDVDPENDISPITSKKSKNSQEVDGNISVGIGGYGNILAAKSSNPDRPSEVANPSKKSWIRKVKGFFKN